jgi:hypothetical protein
MEINFEQAVKCGETVMGSWYDHTPHKAPFTGTFDLAEANRLVFNYYYRQGIVSVDAVKQDGAFVTYVVVYHLGD